MAVVYIDSEEEKKAIAHIVQEMGMNVEQAEELVSELCEIFGVGILTEEVKTEEKG